MRRLLAAALCCLALSAQAQMNILPPPLYVGALLPSGMTIPSPLLSGTVTGTYTLGGTPTIGSAFTYGGVTLTNAVTGTGKMVLDTSPTLVTPNLGVATLGSGSTLGTGGASQATYNINGGSSGSAGGGCLVIQNNGATAFALGNTSACLGGGFSSTLLLLAGANPLTITTTAATISGTLSVAGIASVATTSAVCVNTGTGLLTYDGTIGTCTVSAEDKKVRGESLPATVISGFGSLRTEAWTYNQATADPGVLDARTHVGLYADDVEKLDKRCVAYKDGKIQNYDDRCVMAYVVAAIKELAAR